MSRQRNVDSVTVDIDGKHKSFAQNTYTERKKHGTGLKQQLRSQFPVNNLRYQNQHTLRKHNHTAEVPDDSYATHGTPAILPSAPKHKRQPNTLASLDTVSSNAGGGPASQSDNLVSTNITTALASHGHGQHKSVEMRRKEAE